VAREWDTPVREPWNGTIKASLDAVDRHNDHFISNNYKHLVAAHYLRQYVTYVKDLIIELEEEQASKN
jgi:acyl carrier protein phosphodiesterase